MEWTAVTNLNDSQNCRTSTECQSSQRKIRNIQSESVSKTECFTTRCNTTSATAVSTGLLKVFNFSTRITLFSCLQLWTKNTKEVTLWVTNEVFTRVRARQKSVTCSKTQSQPRKTKCAPKVRRESVWLFPTASIFQTHQAVNLLYLKSIYIFSYLPPPSWYTLNNIVFKEPGGVTGAADCQPGSRGVSPLPLPRHAPCLQVGENS